MSGDGSSLHETNRYVLEKSAKGDPMNKIWKLVGVVFAVLVGLTILKNTLTGMILSGALSKAAHVPVSIGSTDVRFSSASISLKNVHILNPSSFPERLLLDAPEVSISFDPMALTKGQAHFREVKLNLKELVVIKNRDGKLNLDAMKPASSEGAGKPAGESGKMPKLLIDKLDLTIGRVSYKDYSGGGQPSVQTFNINMQNRTYTGIDNPTALVSLILFEALTRTTLSQIANLDPTIFKQGAMNVLNKGMGLVEGGTDSLKDSTKGILKLFK